MSSGGVLNYHSQAEIEEGDESLFLCARSLQGYPQSNRRVSHVWLARTGTPYHQRTISFRSPPIVCVSFATAALKHILACRERVSDFVYSSISCRRQEIWHLARCPNSSERRTSTIKKLLQGRDTRLLTSCFM